MPARLWRRLRALLRGGEMDGELDEELRYHLEREAELNVRGGMAPEANTRGRNEEPGPLMEPISTAPMGALLKAPCRS